MPPGLGTLGLLDCHNWGTEGNSTFLFKMILAVFEFYTWFVACGLIDFAILIMLIYPGEVKLLLLAVLMG